MKKRFTEYWASFLSKSVFAYRDSDGTIILAWFVSVILALWCLYLHPWGTIGWLALLGAAGVVGCAAVAAIPNVIVAGKTVGLARTCVGLYVIFVLLSLILTPWSGWSGGYDPARKIYTFPKKELILSPIFSPPIGLYGAPPKSSRAQTDAPPRLMFPEIVLLWGALGIATVAIVWMSRSEKWGKNRDLVFETPPKPSKANSSIPMNRLPRVIVIDDERLVADCLGFLLIAHREITLRIFQDGKTAWKEIQENPPDLLVTDMNRPSDGFTGWDMLPMLAAHKVQFPIIVCSGYAKREQVHKLAGPALKVTFLPKPVNVEDLGRCLTTHLGPARAKKITP